MSAKGRRTQEVDEALGEGLSLQCPDLMPHVLIEVGSEGKGVDCGCKGWHTQGKDAVARERRSLQCPTLMPQMSYR